MEKRNYESEILDIIETKDWDRAKKSNDENLYVYIQRHRDTNENCKIIWEHIKSRKDYESEVLEIIETKDWDRARYPNDTNLYNYVKRHRDTDENCKIIWEHIRPRDYKSEILEIVETKNWDRARYCNDAYLYNYIKYHKDEDENCRIVWEHIKSRDFESEVLEIIETKNWDRAKGSNDEKLYRYIYYYKDTDENCKIIWEHIKAGREHRSIKRYLLCYFKYGKPKETFDRNLYCWFNYQIKRGNQCCIDVKNLITAAEDYQDPVALETLSLIKNHLENKEGD